MPDLPRTSAWPTGAGGRLPVDLLWKDRLHGHEVPPLHAELGLLTPPARPAGDGWRTGKSPLGWSFRWHCPLPPYLPSRAGRPGSRPDRGGAPPSGDPGRAPNGQRAWRINIATPVTSIGKRRLETVSGGVSGSVRGSIQHLRAGQSQTRRGRSPSGGGAAPRLRGLARASSSGHRSGASKQATLPQSRRCPEPVEGGRSAHRGPRRAAPETSLRLPCPRPRTRCPIRENVVKWAADAE